MNLISLYEPKSLAESQLHRDMCGKMISCLSANKFATILLSGPNGCGKTTAVKLVVKELGFRYKFYNTVTMNHDGLIQEMFNLNHRNIAHMISLNGPLVPTVLIIDNLDHITLNSERNVIQKIISMNVSRALFPLIVIRGSGTNKEFDECLNGVSRFVVQCPSKSDLSAMVTHVCKSEDCPIDDPLQLVEKSQMDLRRLFYILQDYIDTYRRSQDCDYGEFVGSIELKTVDMNLFDSLKEIMSQRCSVTKVMTIYNTDKVLLPLVLHENYHKDIFQRRYSPTDRVHMLSDISELISYGDMIETDIYMDQNWQLQNTHCFIGLFKPVYLLNKDGKAVGSYPINFSSELNKTSLKNINRKNINSISSSCNSSIPDLMCMSYIVNKLLEEQRYDDVIALIKGYPSPDHAKLVETMAKVDKCNQSTVVLNAKNRKKLVF